jgi:hypothetical protein
MALQHMLQLSVAGVIDQHPSPNASHKLTSICSIQTTDEGITLLHIAALDTMCALDNL